MEKRPNQYRLDIREITADYKATEGVFFAGDAKDLRINSENATLARRIIKIAYTLLVEARN